MMDKFFEMTARKTNIRTEFSAALTTFFAMVYILMVNPNIFSDPLSDGSNPLGVSFGAIYIATAISAIIGTLLIGLLANLPLAQASGMGLNAFCVYTVCLGFGFSYANSMVLVLIDGIVFVLLTVTGLRKKIFDSIPAMVRAGIPAGIGLFIALLGLKNSGIVTVTSSGMELGSFNILNMAWGDIMPLVVCLISFFAIVVMSKKNIKGSVLWGILIGMAVYYLFGLTIPRFYEKLSISLTSPFAAFGEFTEQSLFKVFTEGFDFSHFIEANGITNFVIVILTTSLAFCMVDMFDTLGNLYAACRKGNLLTKDDDIPRVNQAMISDAVATCVGAVCGTSTVTTFAESTAGVAEGGRTGLTSVFTAIFFFIAIFLSPIAQLIPGCATAAALLYVGVLMMSSIKDVDWDKLEIAVPAFLTVAVMPFTGNISYGIAFGMISHVVIELFTGNSKKVKISTYVLALMFIVLLLLTH